MKRIVTGNEMKACDAFAIQIQSVPAAVLMERAALSAVEEIKKRYGTDCRVLVLCGSGNNGGDGFAVARLLLLEGIAADIYFAGKTASLTKEAALEKKIFENYGGKYSRKSELSEYTVLVDALFGIGLSRPITGEYAELIELVNACGLPVVSLDIPSGIHADTGEVMGCAIRADLTVSFAFEKLGQILYPGTAFCGELVVRDVGITDHAIADKTEMTFIFEKADLQQLPKRQPRSNKGTYGTAAIISGAVNMAGAAILCAGAAYRTGCGLVRVISAQDNRPVIQAALPEAVFVPWQQKTLVEEALSHARAVAIGPGLGVSRESGALLEAVLSLWEGPLVIDADGLNILSEHSEYLNDTKAQIIITPHPGEMARLLHCETAQVLRNLPEKCRRFADENHLICVLKDARTVVSDGKKRYVNTSGNDGMAVGGSGDVLTGVICSLLAQGMQPFEAACMGVYLHGLAGDYAKTCLGSRSMLARDIVDGIAPVLKTLL